MTALIQKIVDEIHFKEGDNKARVIANRIYNAVLEGELPLASPMPSYRRLANYLDLKESILDTAWGILKNDYQIIETHGVGGTQIVANMPGEIVNGGYLSRLPDKTVYRVTLDRCKSVEVIHATDSFTSRIKGIKAQLNLLSSLEMEDTAKGLPVLMRNRMGHHLGMPFKVEEVFYVHDYQLLIYLLCKILLTAKSVWVTADPHQSFLDDIVKRAGKDICLVPADHLGMLMNDLEDACRNVRVGVVYISSEMIPLHNALPVKERLDKLMALQGIYKFWIVIDNRHPGISDISLVMKKYYRDYQHAIIYLMPLTIIDKELNAVNLIAAPVKVIDYLKERFYGKALTDMLLDATLVHLFHKNLLTRKEKQYFKFFEDLQKAARKVLSEPGIWKQKYIDHSTSWFFYLVPDGMVLPDNIYEDLVTQGIYVVAPSQYQINIGHNKGILISIAAYQQIATLVKDLKKLNQYMKNN